MKCCINCFASNYIKEIITSFNKENGKCDFCKSENASLVDPSTLFYQFKNLIELYIPITKPPTDTNNKPLPIEERINLDFPSKVFQISDQLIIKQLLMSIVQENKDTYENIFSNPVQLRYLVDAASLDLSVELRTSWEKFSNEIQTENRYHITNVIDLEKVKDILSNITKSYKKDKVFYRSRLSNKSGFPKNDMWNPPASKAKAGRANPEGISYLYLSNDIDTTVFEIRANLFDYVSVAEFKLKEEINVVNLRDSDEYDPMPFAEEENLEDFLIYLPFISHLENELSKPVRRNDNELDYISTQYLSEFIKSLGYDGVEYKSSLNPEGYNIALFNSHKVEISNVFVNEITKIWYTHNKIP